MRELRRFGLLLALASDHGALCLLLLICHPEREANLGIAPEILLLGACKILRVEQCRERELCSKFLLLSPSHHRSLPGTPSTARAHPPGFAFPGIVTLYGSRVKYVVSGKVRKVNFSTHT